MRRTGVRIFRVLEFHHPPNFPWILAATPGSQNLRDLSRQITGVPVLLWFPFHSEPTRTESVNNGSSRSILGSFLFVFWWFYWLGYHQVALIYHQPNLTLALEKCHCYSHLSRSRTRISPTVGEEDEDEEDDEEWLILFQKCLWSRWRSRGRTWQAWNHSRNEVLRVARYPNPVFNKMWLLTIDPFIGISVFIAKPFRATILLACFRGLS